MRDDETTETTGRELLGQGDIPNKAGGAESRCGIQARGAAMRTLKQFWRWHCESNASSAAVQSHMMSAFLTIVVHWLLAVIGKAAITRLMLEEMAAISEILYLAATLATGLSMLWCVFVLAAVIANTRRKSRAQHEDS